ncbi:hypothetical protein BJY01DRAFT_247122 [Aspergillus pseudoustus]|uniref:Zn(2)-C6 fungal-type domain-containing protein n=1 Tax=Aspergillus pseudoustus TaxID=1810923 RepID=A0ABR4K3V3_9EURO
MSTDSIGSSRKRHRAPPTDRPSYPRKRAVQACHICRQKRIKCDNEHPTCGSCMRLGVQCIYRENDKSTFDPASITILQRLDTLEGLLRTVLPTGIPCDATVSVQSSAVGPLNHLDSPSLERPNAGAGAGAGYHMNIETALAWPVFQQQGLEPRESLCALLQHRQSPSPELTHVPGLEFESSSAREMFHSFLRHVHTYNPVLEVAEIEQSIRTALFDGFRWDGRSCLLLLIFALGAISGARPGDTSSDFLRSDEARKAEQYFVAAQKRLGGLLCQSGVVEAQVFFYAGVYLMATLRPLEAWRMFVQALACCETFPSRQPPPAVIHPDEATPQRSIYWTCFKSELELRLELNVSRSCALDLTYPAFFPTPPLGLKSEQEAVWYYYLAEIALRRLGNRILNHLYEETGRDRQTQLDATVDFEEQASGLLTSLPALLDLGAATLHQSPHDHDHDNEHDQHAPLRFILNGHLIDCYEMMYWPFVVDAIHDTLPPDGVFHNAFVQFARKGFAVCVQRITQNERGFYHRHHGTWLMLRSCTRSALVLIAGALRGLTALLPVDWMSSVEKVLHLLRYWKDEANDAADRLEVLEGLMEGLAAGGL